VDRRAFLSIVAGSPLIFGLRELLAQDPAPDAAPDWLKAALKRMKETRRFGVVIVVPPGQEAQSRLGSALVARLPQTLGTAYEDLEIFVGNVFICVSDEKARKFHEGKVAGEGLLRILLEPDGSKVVADRVDVGVFEDPSKFRESFRKFVGGDDGSRLRDVARSIEKSLPEDIRKAIEVISSPPRQVETEAASKDLRKAMDLVKGRMDSIATWLVNLSLLKENEKTFLKMRLNSIFWEYYLEQSTGDPAPCLPFGVKVETLPEEDPCPPCGRMAAAPGKARKFLSFFEK